MTKPKTNVAAYMLSSYLVLGRRWWISCLLHVVSVEVFMSRRLELLLSFVLANYAD
jgi:hypothetical protein